MGHRLDSVLCLSHGSISVRVRVEPPAPYVTDANAGSSWRSAASAARRLRSPSSVFGGKNSNENSGSVRLAMISSIRMAELSWAAQTATKLATMGRRARRRGETDEPAAASSTYTDTDGNTLVLRGSLSPRTRARYARLASGRDLPPGANREDAWQRSVEFLFEHLAVSWSIAGAPALTSQSELLGRLRFASAPERAWIRGCIREHCAERFPELTAP